MDRSVQTDIVVEQFPLALTFHESQSRSAQFETKLHVNALHHVAMIRVLTLIPLAWSHCAPLLYFGDLHDMGLC